MLLVIGCIAWKNFPNKFISQDLYRMQHAYQEHKNTLFSFAQCSCTSNICTHSYRDTNEINMLTQGPDQQEGLAAIAGKTHNVSLLKFDHEAWISSQI